MKERNHSLDLMRVFLSICVISLHSLAYIVINNDFLSLVLPVIFISADGIFYIASGYFNLEKEFNTVSDIKKYYKNKILYVVFPFLAFVFVWTVWEYIHLNSSFDFFEVISIYYETVMNSAAEGHMWFMYPLFGMLLATPFLSKMLHNMNEKELKILWYIALGYNIVSYYLCMDIGISFRFLAWFFDGWIIYYFAGYYYRHVVVNESKIKWTLLGLFGLTFTLLGMCGDLPFFKNFVGATDIQPMFTIFCLACLLFWDKGINIKDGKLSKIITFLSKNTYLIYLYHMRSIEYVARKLSITEASVKNGFVVVFGAFFLSLIAAYVTNLCLKPVQKLIEKIWVIKE